MIGTVTAVEAVYLGGALTADAASGATTLGVDITTDFDEVGGSLRLNDVTYTYTAVEDETVYLAGSGLTAAAAEGDPVNTLDAQGNPEVEWIAWVDLGDDGDPVPALIPTALVVDFPEGEAVTGQLVEVVIDRDDYVVTTRPGQIGGRSFSSRFRNSPQTLADSTYATVLFNSFDTSADIDMSYAMGVYTIKTPGVYLAVARVAFAANATGRRVLRMAVNGVGSQNSRVNLSGSEGGSDPILQLVDIVTLQEGDTVSFEANQTSGGDLDIVTPSTSVRLARLA